MRLRFFLRGSLGSGFPIRRGPRRALILRPKPLPLRIAVYVSAHGLGHAVRVAALLDEARRQLDLRLTVIGPDHRRVWPRSLAAVTEAWSDEPCDVGVRQSDDVTVDLEATGSALERWLKSLPSLREREHRRLADRFDLVVADVPSVAVQAARSVGIPALALANFSWDWIYRELGFDAAAEACAEAYAEASLLLRASPFAPMAAFPRVEDVGLVARAPSPRREQVRAMLGLSPEERAVLLAFQPVSAPSLRLPPAREGRRWLAPASWPRTADRADLSRMAPDFAFEDAVAAADVVVGKPGYGLIGDVEAAGARFLYVPRPGFPENAVLEDHLATRAGTMRLPAPALSGGGWEEPLAALEALPRPLAADTGGAARGARALVALAAPALVDCAPEAD